MKTNISRVLGQISTINLNRLCLLSCFSLTLFNSVSLLMLATYDEDYKGYLRNVLLLAAMVSQT